MYGLSLCAGIGGLDLGLSIAIPTYRTVCYVERDRDCHRHLVGAPIWDDLETFPSRDWCGAVDLVLAGFPCQPFSSAARGNNTHPDLWPFVLAAIEGAAPPVVFLENVIRHHGAERDLCDLGYAVASTFVAAATVGAPHKRRRWFALGVHPDRYRESALSLNAETSGLPEPDGASGGPWDDPRGDLSVADGIPARLYGNAVVPLVAAYAFRTLATRLGLVPPTNPH